MHGKCRGKSPTQFVAELESMLDQIYGYVEAGKKSDFELAQTMFSVIDSTWGKGFKTLQRNK
jgi:hypothetical protein